MQIGPKIKYKRNNKLMDHEVVYTTDKGISFCINESISGGIVINVPKVNEDGSNLDIRVMNRDQIHLKVV